jgi:hypothetical protein
MCEGSLRMKPDRLLVCVNLPFLESGSKKPLT